MLGEEAEKTNVIVLVLARSGIEPTIYRIRGEHGVVPLMSKLQMHIVVTTVGKV